MGERDDEGLGVASSYSQSYPRSQEAGGLDEGGKPGLAGSRRSV